MKLINIFLLTLFVIIFSSCEKAQDSSNLPTEESANLSSLRANDPLVISLSKINSYIIERNNATNGELIAYTKSNPNYTFDELERLGFIDKSYLLPEMEIIKKEASNRSEEELMDIAKNIVSPEFTSGIDVLEDPNSRPFCIFCCTGCLTKDPNCFTVLFWSWGDGC